EEVPGVEVSVKGRVLKTYGPYVFEMGSGPERVIVVQARPNASVEGKEVEVTGRVRTFRRRELQDELGVDLGADVSPLEEQTCLVATEVRDPPRDGSG
ncbi:MAG: hypothetical protein M3179_01645, partial [Actinomycetota bacterium]|nr:hypothetical protein [Actinomycetota bacterium]